MGLQHFGGGGKSTAWDKMTHTEFVIKINVFWFKMLLPFKFYRIDGSNAGN